MKKRLVLTALLVCAVMWLAGCGCKHENTYVPNYIEPVCQLDGYTGDTWCSDCNKQIATGEAIPALEHNASPLLLAAPATCSAEGYTGHVVCELCGETLQPGETIPMLEHTPVVVNAAEASCAADGHTGDTVCSVCKTVLAAGEVIPAFVHTPGERVNMQDASCVVEGYTGDVLCTVCGKVLEKGEAIPMTEHTPGDLYNAKEPTCVSIGYTGSASCTWCQQTVIYSEEIPRTEHPWGELEGVVAPTCTQIGYTGDRTCTVCQTKEKGEEIPREPHSYVDNVCTACGWMTPGLYNGGELVFTWQQLVDNGLIEVHTMDRNARDYEGYMNFDVIAENMEGMLVVDESINMIGFTGETFIYGYRTFENCAGLKEVWLPCTMNFIGRFPFENSGVEKIRCFGEIELLMDGAFKNAACLKDFDIPEGITSVGFQTFYKCAALESVTLPSTLRDIGYQAFYGCTALKKITLPEGLEMIDNGGFGNTGLETVTLPSTLTTLEIEAFVSCSNLTHVDASKAQLTELLDRTFACENLRSIKLPSVLESMVATMGNAPVETLNLPQGFTNLKYDMNLKELKTIVWPLSFVDKNKVLINAKPENVYYEGSEIQWKTLYGDLYPEANMVYNYDYTVPVE